MRSVKVIFSLVRESHPVVTLWVLIGEFKRVFTRLDAVLVSVFLQKAQGAVGVKDVQDVISLHFLLLSERLFLALGHVLKDRDAS